VRWTIALEQVTEQQLLDAVTAFSYRCCWRLWRSSGLHGRVPLTLTAVTTPGGAEVAERSWEWCGTT